MTEIPARTGCFLLAAPSERGELPESSCSIKSHFSGEHNDEVYLTLGRSRSPKDFCNAILGAAQHITFEERSYECLSELNFCIIVCSFPFFVSKPETMPPVIMLAAVSVGTQDPAAMQSKQQVPCDSLRHFRKVVQQSKHQNPYCHDLDYNLDLRPTPADCGAIS